MKKIITLVLIVVIVIAGYVIFQNKEEVSKLQVNKPTDDSIAPSEVQIENWSTYTNSQNGVQFFYPTDFKIEEKTGYPQYIDFDSPLVKLGSSFELVIYDTQRGNITSLDTIPRLTKANETQEVLSTDNKTVNSIPVQVVKGVQYSINKGKIDKNLRSDMLSVVFMKGKNAYTINWMCWSNKACFNDEVVNKLVDSIKFTK